MVNAIEEWLKEVKISCKASTYTNYEYIVNAHLLPTFKDYKLNDITIDIINDFTSNLLFLGYDSKYIRDILTILKQILKRKDIIFNIKMPKLKKKDITILTSKDQELLERYILSNVNCLNIGIYLSLYMGLRIGEVCALKWGNIDLDKSILHVEKTLIRVKNENDNKCKTRVILADPKSISSIRDIPIPKFIVAILKVLKVSFKDNFYLLTGSEKFIEPRCYANYFSRILKRVQINKYNFHVLRHTFATNCVKEGCDAKTLSVILGHANVRITLDKYVHPDLEAKRNMMNSINPKIKLKR